MKALVIGGFIKEGHQLQEMKERNIDGTFKRIRTPFSLDNFNDGYIDADGRKRVFMPNHPRASKEGYILRAIVAYELYHNVSVPKNMVIHHIDGNRLNDSEDNLIMMLFGQHTSFHNKSRKNASLTPRQCKQCKKEFLINKWRLKDLTRGQFCSQKCYINHPKSEEHKQHISQGMINAYKEGRR